MTTPPTSDSTYCSSYLPPDVLEKLQAGAFRQLMEHLRERSTDVQNIDLMTISGFCRNCLAKWMVVEARSLSQELQKTTTGDSEELIQALDALGYDEAAQHVYGMHYGDWKKRYSKKATDEVMDKYNASKPLWAQHDKELLATRAEKPTEVKEQQQQPTSTTVTVLSNVCCQDVELVAAKSPKEEETTAKKSSRQITPQTPPAPSGSLSIKVSVLTISDRASAGDYSTGDLSGPAVVDALAVTMKELQKTNSNLNYTVIETAIVPDDITAIQDKLKEWCTTTAPAGLDLILTTGGTGVAPRDVTPEATQAVLHQECHGLMAYVTNECSKLQPLASLSRGTAGVRGKTLIANLPGNPQGAQEIVPVFLPLALHAIVDLQKQK